MEPGAPTAFIIAGPNGAGKTSFARKFLPALGTCDRFINADLIAAALSPLHPEREAFRAGRIMLELIDEAVAARSSFAVETTLSSRNYLNRISDWKQAGYHVALLFVALDSPDLAVARVSRRVSEGGHHIPKATIFRRFERGLSLLDRYCAAVNEWYHYDNSSGEFIPQASSHG